MTRATRQSLIIVSPGAAEGFFPLFFFFLGGEEEDWEVAVGVAETPPSPSHVHPCRMNITHFVFGKSRQSLWFVVVVVVDVFNQLQVTETGTASGLSISADVCREAYFFSPEEL